MEEIEIAYNRELKSLEAVLSGVKNPGDFFISGMEEMPMPRIEVEGTGTLSFPVPDAQIAALLRTAERAPFGRGEKTIVDTGVRNAWQIAPSKVKISGKSWAANFKKVFSTVTAGLGCDDDPTISAELYKLLVYKEGGFFLAHRDTEKTDGMFGTLVVTLPSSYLGGTLRIRHGSREVTVETKAPDPSELSYVAFFADCEHEALPVREGSRVCLVYNLIQQRSKGRRRILKAPEYESPIAEATAILDRFLNAAEAPAKIVWLLDHQYSPAGLSFSTLKGADAARARVLLRAAAKAQCAAHLGIVHIGESGEAEYDFGYSYGSRRRFYEYEDEESGEDDDNETSYEDVSFTAASVDDGWQYVDQWRDTDDRVVGFGRIPLADGELLPAGALDGEAPDSKRITEATGNEGATFERSYHRAALVLWLQRRAADVLLQAGVVAALPHLKQLAAGGESARQEAIAAAERILEAWPDDKRRWNTYAIDGKWPQSSDRIEMIAALVSLNAPALLERFLREVITAAYDGSENPALVSSVSVIGEARAAAVLSALVSTRMPDRPAECTELLLALAGKPPYTFPEVAEAAVAGLDRIGISGSKSVAYEWEPQERRHPLTPEFLENLLLALQVSNKETLCDDAAEKIASRPEIFSPVTLVVPAIEQIGARNRKVTTPAASSVRRLWASAAEFLLGRSEAPPPPPDWCLDVKLPCGCPDCGELQAFARNPDERVHRFRVKKERRRHLHSVIDEHRLDMTHETEHVGSPQTLICTKDRRTFNGRVKQYGNEMAAMRTLLGLADQFGGDALSRRMEAAVKLAADLNKGRGPSSK